MKELLKEKIISDFIKDNNRSPTREEVKNLYRDLSEEFPTSEEVGLLAGTHNNHNYAGEESSSKKYNELINKLKLDHKYAFINLKQQEELIESTFRNTIKEYNKSLSNLKELERNANKNLLLHSDSTVYNYSIVESFEDYEKVIFDESNINFYNGKATLSFKKIGSDGFNIENIEYTTRSRNGNILYKTDISSIRNVNKEDGSYFKTISRSSIADDVIDFIIDITFKGEDGEDLETIKFTTYTPEVNSKVSYKCLYSTDLNQYKPVFESDLRLNTGENYIEVNRKSVRRLRLIFTKYHYDYKENQEYNYIFSLDFLGYTRNTYKINEESVLKLGPYEILNENQEPINFSLATLKGGTCCIIPEESSVDFYLSKDNVNWFKAGFTDTSRSVVQFDNSLEDVTSFNLFRLVDEDSTSNYIADETPEEIDLLENEFLLNFYIPTENKEFFIKNSLEIKRNVNFKSSAALYGADSGWYLKDNYYHTTFEIDQIEGKYLDFGNRSCFINDRQVVGKVFVPMGVHTFKTKVENWNKIQVDKEIDLKNVRQLKAIDNLYPYNHKYVIEGFNYTSIFRGPKIYKGVSKNYSYLLKQISKQKFSNSDNLGVYTLLENESGIYIKINSKSNSSEVKLEKYEIKYRRTSNVLSNLLYIKAVLKTSNEKITPKIDQIQVRVI